MCATPDPAGGRDSWAQHLWPRQDLHHPPSLLLSLGQGIDGAAASA